MTETDQTMAIRALRANFSNLDEVRDAVAALRHTSAPCLAPLREKYEKRLAALEDRARAQFVLGFAFTADLRVALISKKRPESQYGKLNGIGGRVAPGETWLDAMVREFTQETGLALGTHRWTHFATLRFPAAEVVCYKTRLLTGEHVDSPTDERVDLYPVPALGPGLGFVPHTQLLIAAALDDLAEPAVFRGC